MRRSSLCGGSLILAVQIAGCAGSAKLPVSAGTGPNPVLPAPSTSLIPTIKVAKAVGWRAGEMPTGAPGTAVTAFARGLDHPRWLYVLPNGDVLVAETNAPPRPDAGKGIKGMFFKYFQEKAGAAVPSANRITLLRDADGDGVAETRSTFLTGLNSPFGMALVGDNLYVANADAVVRFPYVSGAARITAAPVKIVDLPAGPINQHWTRSLLASPDGSRLYVGVGSASNVGEHGIQHEFNRAAILEVDVATNSFRVFASGLRNPVGITWNEETGELWTSVNERDELGSDVVPDYMTSVKDSGFYGWPYSYFGQHVDERVEPRRPDLVATAIVPDYALGPHTGSLGLAYARTTRFTEPFRHGMFVGQHGSWNRTPRSGYKVIFIPFENGRPAGQPIDVLTGFLDAENHARGRPVGVAIDTRGGLLVADDVGNVVWRVSSVGSR
ncbi:MAG: PQQ-dependent sugar dehydrogenase [Gemmatimonadota bacterium]